MLPKAKDCAVADLATAGLDTVAVRIPAHPVAREILRAFGGPVVAPSANLSGHVSPTTAAHVQGDLDGRIDLIVDGGAVDGRRRNPRSSDALTSRCCCGPAACRASEIERVLGRALMQPPEDAESDSGQPLAPGMLASHYAPRTKVRLNAERLEPGEALLAFGPRALPGADARVVAMNLSARSNLAEAAANLFGYLRALDAANARAIAVMPIPDERIGRSHQRPAAPRSGRT